MKRWNNMSARCLLTLFYVPYLFWFAWITRLNDEQLAAPVFGFVLLWADEIYKLGNRIGNK